MTSDPQAVHVDELPAAAEALRESEEKFAKAFHASPDSININRLSDGRFVDVNPGFLALTGYGRDEVIGRTSLEIDLWANPADRERLKAELARAGRVDEFEAPFRLKDGAVRLGQMAARLITIGGEPHIISVTRDIHDRKQAETTLRESELRFRRITENMTDLVAEADREGLYRYVSPSFRTVLGFEPESLIGERAFERIHPDDLPGVLATFAASVEDGVSRSVEFRYGRADGRYLWFQTSGQVLFDADGALDGFVVSSREITDRRRAEEALQHRAAELAALSAVSRSVNASLSLDQTIVAALEGTANAIRPDLAFFFLRDGDRLILQHVLPASGRQRLGVVPEHRVGECLCGLAVREKAALYSADIFDDRRCTWEKCKKAGLKSFAALPLISSDEVIGVIGLASETERDFGRQSRFLETLAGQVSVAIANARLFEEARRELVERRRAEAEKEALHGQLLQSQKMESVGRLAGGVAHDFNNMLGVIMGRAELALMDPGASDAVRADLEEILAAGRQSADLTRQLLAFARKQTASPKVLDLNAAVSGTLKMLRRLIGEDVTLVYTPGQHLWPVRIDPSQVDQVLANLVVNARDAMATAGTLGIRTANVLFDEASCAVHVGSVPGEHVLLAVSDTGAGMSREVLDHAFEPFFTTKAAGQGTGLGLSTVYGVVKQNGGFITAESQPGTGTTVRIWLPRAIGVDGSSPLTTAGDTPTGTETVLIVEDADAMLELGRVMLARLGYTVLTARSPTDAVRLVLDHAEPIHLVITDVVMPDMNGKDLAARLTAIKPALKCLFMSGYTADIISHHGVIQDGVHFVQKPFSMSALAQGIRKALE